MAMATTQLHPAIQRYLTALESSLRQMPGVAPEEGLADAHEFLQSEWESLARRGTAPDDDGLFQHFADKFGAPEEVAADYATALDADGGAAERRGTTTLPLARPRLRAAVLVGILLLGIGLAAAMWMHVIGSRSTTSANEPVPQWASRVVSFTRGAGESKLCSDPAAALGPPNAEQDDRDESTYVALGLGGELVLEFAAPFGDGIGPDLKIVEVGPLAEATDVAVSRDGREWIDVGRAKGAEATIDLAPFVRPQDRFRYVRLIDAQSVKMSKNNWPGADIDAVAALHTDAQALGRENVAFAQRIVRAERGENAPARSNDPLAALGLPDCLDSAKQPETYYSLGYGGELVVEFVDQRLVDGKGADLAIFEVGYPEEPVDVAVSEDGEEWFELGRTGRDVKTLDLAGRGLSGKKFRFVRIVDAKTKISNKSEFWGADIDAIVALNAEAARP
jgi:hypothetical protein